MRNRVRKWVIAASSLIVVATSLVAATGVSHAEDGSWLKVRMEWDINLTDSDDDKTCAQSSEQIGYISPDNTSDDVITMVAPDWEEKCGDATSRVSTTVRRKDNGYVELTITLRAMLGGSTWGKKTVQMNIIPDSPVTVWNTKLPPSSRTTAAAEYAASARSVPDYEAPFAFFSKELSKDDVKGQVTVYLYRTGQWIFSGSLKNEGFSTKDVKLTCVIRTSDGTGFTFETGGQTAGDLTSIVADASKTHRWSMNEDNTKVWGAFKKNTLAIDSPFDCDLSVEVDTSEDVLGGVLLIVNVARFILGI